MLRLLSFNLNYELTDIVFVWDNKKNTTVATKAWMDLKFCIQVLGVKIIHDLDAWWFALHFDLCLETSKFLNSIHLISIF